MLPNIYAEIYILCNVYIYISDGFTATCQVNRPKKFWNNGKTGLFLSGNQWVNLEITAYQ